MNPQNFDQIADLSRTIFRDGLRQAHAMDLDDLASNLRQALQDVERLADAARRRDKAALDADLKRASWPRS